MNKFINSVLIPKRLRDLVFNLVVVFILSVVLTNSGVNDAIGAFVLLLLCMLAFVMVLAYLSGLRR